MRNNLMPASRTAMTMREGGRDLNPRPITSAQLTPPPRLFQYPRTVIDWGGKVAAWFGAVCIASAALATLIATTVTPPQRGLPHAAFIVLLVIAAVSFALLLLTGPRAAWSTWRNWRTERVSSRAGESPAPAPQVVQPLPQQQAQAVRQGASPGAILRAAKAGQEAERARQIRKLYGDGQVLRARIASLGSESTTVHPMMRAELMQWENEVYETLRSEPEKRTRFRSVPEVRPFQPRADEVYRRITQQLEILDPD